MTTTTAPARRPRNAKSDAGIDQLNARADRDRILAQIATLFSGDDEAAPVVAHEPSKSATRSSPIPYTR